jgi:hypothetical protein
LAKSFISKYATSHPWEDWAETWAHYLHIMDMLETAYFFGLNVKPIDTSNMKANVTVDPYTEVDFDVIIETCIPYHLLSIALTERWVFLMFIHLLLQRI